MASSLASTAPLSPAEAAAHVLTRRHARKSLIGFTEYTFAGYRTARHHRLIAGHLERVARREIDRLMLLLPPRHGKTELASRRYPAWRLGLDPTRDVIVSSAASEFATEVGREVRNTIASREFKALFPDVQLAVDAQAAGRWRTDKGGGFYAVGVGSQVMGRGADDFVIDDPFGTMADAQNELERERVWNWYMGTVYNRLQPGGAIVVINHRMHEEDLSGRLLDRMRSGSGDQWEVVEMPALSDDGEALWPEAYPAQALHRIRDNSIPRYWSALYQQNPVPDEGNFFKREWLRWYDEKPAHLHIYGASDYAVTADGGDYTVHGVAGVDPDDNLYILDWWRSQSTSDVWIETLLDMAKKWQPLMWAEENGQILKSIGPFLEQRSREREVYFAREQFASTHDKATRAQSIRGRMAMGKVYLPNSAPWLADLLAVLMAFPAGRNDDDVDVLSLFGRMLDTMVGAARPKGPKPPRDRWDRAFGRGERDEDSYRIV